MPGIKRRGSQLPISEKPPKLKKQSTSATTATAKGKVEKKKKPNQVESLDSPPKLEKISAVNSPRKMASPGKKSPEKKYKMPRFPTLKPTKPSTDAVDFSISAPSFYSKSSPSTNFTKLKKDSTIKLSSKEPENKLNNDKETCLTSEATEILPPQLEIEVDPSFTRASEIEKKMQKLPSGSIVGKITNLEFDDLILPLEASDVIYEFSDESSSPTYGASKITSGGLQSRASAFEVAEYLTSLDKPSSENTSEPLTKIEEEKCETVDEEKVKTDNEMEENVDKPDKESSDEDSDRPVQDNDDKSDDDSDKTEDKEESKPETKTSETTSPVKTPRKVPGGLREIVFSFDTTGSMYNYMEEAGERIRDLVKRLQNEMPGIRLAFMAHGDYYDLSHDRYLIKWIDFGASIEEVVKFFDNLSITHGGDDDECYELVLRKTRESLSWTPGSQRSLVLIGDSDPHEPGYKYEQFVNDIDWRVETALLKEMGIRIYGLQVGYRSDFYKQISKITGGAHLRLDNASFTYETLMSICLREGSLKLLKSYENEVRKAKKHSEEGGILDLELERLFSSLKSVEDNKSTKTMLKEQKLALKEEKKAKKALELEAKGGKRPTESGGESSPAKKLKVDKKSPPKVPGKFKNAATAKILSKAKRTIIEKKLVKTSPVTKGTKDDDSSADQEEDAKSNVKKKGKVKQFKSSPKNSPKSVKKSVKSGSVVQKDSPKKKDSDKKKPGRPSKTQSDGDKKTGRPPKSKASDGKKKPGRPAKVQEKEKKKPMSQNDSEKKKPGRPSKSAPSTPNKKKKVDDKENVKEKVTQLKTRGVQPKRNESKTRKSVQSPKSSPAAKNSPGKITKPKVSPRVNNKKATLLKKSVKDTTNSVVKKQEKTQVAKKTEKSTPVNKTKSESKTPRKTQKAEKTPPKSKASPKVSKPVKKQPRETAAVTKFVMGPLSVLSWENWLPLITHTKPDVKTEDWKRKPSVSPGFCNDKVYNGEASQAVYEIAVSPPDSTKRYPVYYAVDALWSCFTSPHVKKEVERIIKAKGSISVRKGSMGKQNDAVFQKAVDFMKLNFDYAWDGRGEDVKKDGFVIAKGT